MKYDKIYILGRGAAQRDTTNPELNNSTGKDYAAEYLKDKLGLSFESSSYFACKHFLYDKFKEEFGYETIEECYEDRHSEGMRQRWFEEIKKLNSKDFTFLSSKIFNKHSIYVGLRSLNELKASLRIWPDAIAIWIDASSRCQLEGNESCDITADDCHIVIPNNGTLEEFEERLDKLVRLLS